MATMLLKVVKQKEIPAAWYPLTNTKSGQVCSTVFESYVKKLPNTLIWPWKFEYHLKPFTEKLMIIIYLYMENFYV